MTITPSAIFSGIIFGIIGLYVFRDGRRKTNYFTVFIGVGLMVYPYFTTGPLADWGVGIILCIAAYYLRNAEY